MNTAKKCAISCQTPFIFIYSVLVLLKSSQVRLRSWKKFINFRNLTCISFVNKIILSQLQKLHQVHQSYSTIPSMAACRALIGSISVTMTLHPNPRSDMQQPLPTSPYPATSATFPASMISVARLIPSQSDSRHP